MPKFAYQQTQQYDQLLKQFEDFKEEQMKFNQELLKPIQQRDEYISKKLENRDRELLDAVRGMQETQKLIAARKKRKRIGGSFGNNIGNLRINM
jgi:hypothetical protein